MSRKKIIIVGVVLLIMIVVSVVLISDTKQTPGAQPPAVGVFPSSNEDSSTETNGSGVIPRPSTTNNPTPVVKSSSRLIPISQKPVAGFITFRDIVSSSTIVRYVERETGHVYEYLPAPKELDRISNTTIPGIQEAIWAESGEHVALRYLDGKASKIKTFLANVSPGGNSTSTIEGRYLADNIVSVIVAPRERTAAERFLTVEKKTSQALIDILEFTGVKHSRLLTLNVPEWHIDWPASGILLFTTSPSGAASGYTYLYDVARGVNTQDVRLERILGPRIGLTAIGSPTGNLVLFSHNQGTGVVTKIFNIKTKTELGVGLSTLSEKCAWSAAHPTIVYCAVPAFLPPATYPDAWYQGLVHFSDILWRIDTTTGTARVLLSPEKEVSQSIDATSLRLDTNDEFLYFKDKTSGLLWQFSL